MKTRNSSLVALLCGLFISGCSGSSTTTDPGVSSALADGLTAYVLPLDDYIMSPRDQVMTSYVDSLLVEQCMIERGYEWATPRFDVDSYDVPTRSASGRRIFNDDLAGKYGYHNAPDWLPPDVTAEQRRLNSIVLSPDERAALDSCGTEARATLPLPPNLLQLSVQLANEALMQAGQADTVVAAAEGWRDCMLPLGIADLPQMPVAGQDQGMPPASLMEKWNVGDPDSAPGADEIRVAVADAECRDSSGFSRALYDAEWALQSEAVQANADRLVREREEYVAWVADARSLLSELGG